MPSIFERAMKANREVEPGCFQTKEFNPLSSICQTCDWYKKCGGLSEESSETLK